MAACWHHQVGVNVDTKVAHGLHCKLKYKVPMFFPVIFHNMSGYDSHLFIQTLGNSKGDISCIPINEKNYFFYETGHH